MALLHIDQLTKSYLNGLGSTKALNHVSLEVEKGEFIAIVGHSGSGKTTLLNMIAGLDQVSEGHLFYEGNDLTKMNEDELALLRLKNIGVIYQFFNLIPMLSGRDNISLQLRMAEQKINESEILNIAQSLGIANKLDSYPSQMSGGEQQRVAVARTLINQCDILLADEPTGNLDQKTSNELIQLLIKLNTEQQLTILLITHDLNIAKQAKRMIVLEDGEIIRDVRNESSL